MIGRGTPLSFDAEGAALGRWGRLVNLGGARFGIRNSAGGSRSLDMLPSGMVGLSGWLDEESGLLVLAAERHDRLYVIDLTVDELVTEVDLDREPNVGLRYTRFVATGETSIACLYEGGAVAIGNGGRELWHSQHPAMSLTFREVRDGVAWFDDEWPSAETPVVGLRVSDGAHVG